MGLERLINEMKKYEPPDKLVVVEDAYSFAEDAHQGQFRASGESYVEHSLETAYIVAAIRLDVNSVAAALLHDVPEDCGVPMSDIEAKFGSDIMKLVDGVTKLSAIAWVVPSQSSKEQSQAENIRKMLVAMAEDIRVVFIKLADRLHNMRTLGALSHQKRRNIAKETLEIYSPLAHRLGMWEQKGELEDLAFYHLYPAEYQRVSHLVDKRQTEQNAIVEQTIQTLREELRGTFIDAEVSGRSKSLYSIYQKMGKYEEEGKDFGDIHDVLALRVIVDETGDCYNALGLVHSLWHPLAGEFDDYIANPKENGYQSLHTTVMCFGTIPLEIQIRTHDMHRTAEYGVLAHWLYKEGLKPDMQFERRIAWFRQLLEWHREIGGATEFLESVKTDLFNDQVFVYTPMGEIKDLPIGSTPLDFAYCIHTDVGHRCVGSKVNGRLQPLNYVLRNGDTVEIVTSKKLRGPSRDWLNHHLGYIVTSRAKQCIRQWFRKQERDENLERGREILEKELRRLGISLTDREGVARLFHFENLEEFYVAIGYGEVSPSSISSRLAEEQDQPKVVQAPREVVASTMNIRVLGVGQLLTSLARCCNPLPGDEVIGYVTRSRGVSVHRKDCSNVSNVQDQDKERLVSVDWGGGQQLYPAMIRVDAWDRVGLLRDVCTLVAGERLNIVGMSSSNYDESMITLLLTIEIKSITQLSRVLTKLEGISNVISASRCTEVHGVEV